MDRKKAIWILFRPARPDWRTKQKHLYGWKYKQRQLSGWMGILAGWGETVTTLGLQCVSPGSPCETRSSRRCCSGPWASWPALLCGGRTQRLSCRMARTQTRGCSHVTLWTGAFYDSRCRPSRNSPEGQTVKAHKVQIMCVYVKI